MEEITTKETTDASSAGVSAKVMIANQAKVRNATGKRHCRQRGTCATSVNRTECLNWGQNERVKWEVGRAR